MGVAPKSFYKTAQPSRHLSTEAIHFDSEDLIAGSNSSNCYAVSPSLGRVRANLRWCGAGRSTLMAEFHGIPTSAFLTSISFPHNLRKVRLGQNSTEGGESSNFIFPSNDLPECNCLNVGGAHKVWPGHGLIVGGLLTFGNVFPVNAGLAGTWRPPS